jgi:hypothetical protein
VNIGDRVRIERDEKLHPSTGTWLWFRGRNGTVVQLNDDEYGAIFGKVWERADRPGVLRWDGDDVVTWFKAHELTKTRGAGSTGNAGRVCGAPKVKVPPRPPTALRSGGWPSEQDLDPAHQRQKSVPPDITSRSLRTLEKC